MPRVRRRSRRKVKRSRKTARATPPRQSSSAASITTTTTTPKQEATATSLLLGAESLQDKIEFSPNARAKCQKCRRKIQVGEQRYGISEHSERYNKEIYRYYHGRCCPATLKARVPFAAEELNRQRQEQRTRAQLLEERHALYENLKTLRQIFARRMGYEPCIILQNSTLEDLVVKMPTSQIALLNVNGIGPKKCENFGDSIIRLIKQYKRQVGEEVVRRIKSTNTNSGSSRRANSSAAAGSAADVIAISSGSEGDHDEDDDEEDGIEVGKSLTCEEIVNKKFEHAAANGYVISID